MKMRLISLNYIVIKNLVFEARFYDFDEVVLFKSSTNFVLSTANWWRRHDGASIQDARSLSFGTCTR